MSGCRMAAVVGLEGVRRKGVGVGGRDGPDEGVIG